MLLYNQLLDRYNTIDEQRRQQPVRVSMVNPPGEAPTVLPPTTVDPSPAVSSLLESEIVESAPKTMKKKSSTAVGKTEGGPDDPVERTRGVRLQRCPYSRNQHGGSRERRAAKKEGKLAGMLGILCASSQTPEHGHGVYR